MKIICFAVTFAMRRNFCVENARDKIFNFYFSIRTRFVPRLRFVSRFCPQSDKPEFLSIGKMRRVDMQTYQRSLITYENVSDSCAQAHEELIVGVNKLRQWQSGHCRCAYQC